MVMDPNRIHVVNAYTGLIYGNFELDVEARQYMKNHLLRQTDPPGDASSEIPTIWCFDARNAETNSF
jgi:hypothetical protein